MISRLFISSIKRSSFFSVRNLRVSSVVLGGGHHDDHGPVPVYKPKPGPSERNFFGQGKSSRISEDAAHVPSTSDYASYVGAALGVLLTFLAIAYKTEVFSSKSNHDHHAKPKRILGPGESPHEESAGPLKPTPLITTAQPEAVEMERQPAAERQASQQAPREKRNEGEQMKLTKTHEPPSEVTPMTPNPETKAVEKEEKETSEVSDKSSSENSTDKSSSDEGASGSESMGKVSPDNKDKAVNPDEIPEYVEYLLVGAGTASYYAALAIRARDAEAKVLMIGDEKHLPYNRPPLTKELWWYGDENSSRTLKYKALSGKTRDVFFESQGFFVPCAELPTTKHGGVSILREKRVVRICPSEKKAFLEDGSEIRYGKCLLATGGRPKSVSELKSSPSAVKDKILYFRGVDDYRKLDNICSESNSVTVIGGGFLGSELAYGMKRKYPNLEVNQIMKEKGNLARVLPEFLSVRAVDSLKKHGVNVLTETRVVSAREADEKIEIKITGSKQEKLNTDLIVVATGIEPETSMIEASGLEIDSKLGGVLADAELRVCPSVYCAGDVCSFFDRSLGRRRVEHWEHAQITGRLAGENMTGGEKPFWFQSSFFSKFTPEYHFNAVGNTDASLDTVSVFAKDENDNKYERGVVFYKDRNSKVVGVLMVNVFGPSLDVGRRLIEDNRLVEDYRELAKLFPLFEQPKEESSEEEKH